MSGLGSGGFLPVSLGSFNDHALFEGVGSHANVTDLAINQSLDALEVGHEPPLGDGSHVRADAAFFLGFTAAPDVAAFDGPGPGQFTKSCHKIIFLSKGGEKLPIRGDLASTFCAKMVILGLENGFV